MRLNELISSKAVKGGLLGLAVTAGLLSGLSAGVARADSPGIPNPYRADALNSSTVRVLWINTASEGDGHDVHFNMRYRLQSSKPDVYSSYTYIGGGGPPNDLGLNVGNPNDPTNLDYMEVGYKQGGEHDVTGLAANTSYCFSMRSFTYYVGLFSSPDDNIPPTFSPWSGELCTTTPAAPVPAPGTGATANGHDTLLATSPFAATHISTSAEVGALAPLAAPTKPDLDAVSITGPASVSEDVNAVYTATIRNDGTTANGNVEVVIGMSGAFQAWDSIQQSIGLNCTQGSGQGANTFTCEGGTLAAGQTATLQFRAHAAGAGQGTIVLSLNPSRALDEGNYGNNLQILNVTVTK
jgi:hypothetical protein